MSDGPQGPGWWQASDGRWYPPQGPQPAPGGPPPPNAYGYGVPASGSYGTNTKATVSLVLGIAGLVACGFFTGIPAIIVGSSAKKEIEATGGRQEGRGLAVAGQVLGWISVALGAVAVVAILAITVIGVSASDDINSDPADGVCNPDRFWQDPDC